MSNEPMVKTIPLCIPDLHGREDEYLATCVRDNWVSSAGPYVTQLEQAFSEHCAPGHAVAVSSGTAALHLCLVAAGVTGPEHRVVVPDWTFVASVNAVRHAGATPVFVDITEESWTLDPNALEVVLSRPDHGVRAVIAVHTLGHPADMDALRAVCAGQGIVLIEDAAGALGSLYKGRPAGSIGDMAAFSLNGNKIITAGGGGIIVTPNAEQARLVRHLSTQARIGSDYEHDAVGYNYRMTNLNAAVGLAQFERLDAIVAKRRAIAQSYDAAFSNIVGITPMPRATWVNSNCWLYSVQLESEVAAKSLVEFLQERRIESRIFWRSVSSFAPYQEFSAELNGVSRALSGRVVSLPCSHSLTDVQQNRVIDSIDAWRQ